MGTRKIVPLRPARKEGATDAPTPLTLADVTISHVPAPDTCVRTGSVLPLTPSAGCGPSCESPPLLRSVLGGADRDDARGSV